MNYFKSKSVFFVLILFIFLVGSLLFSIDTFFYESSPNKKTLRHWTTNHDEIHIVYNALLLNNGLIQEYLGHPSVILIYLLSFTIKIFHLFNFLDVSTIRQFIESNNVEENLNKLFFVSRILIFVIAISFCLLSFAIFKLVSRNFIISVFLTILFIFSKGFIASTNVIDSAQLSAFLLFFSLYYLLRFLLDQEHKNIHLFFFCFLIFAAIIQKIQVFFLIIPVILISFFFAKKTSDINIKILNIKYNKKLYLILFASVSFIIIIKSLVYKSINSAFFLIFHYWFINLIFYFYTKEFQKNIYKNLILFNIIVLFSYLFLKTIVSFHPSANLEVFNVSFPKFIETIKPYSKSFLSLKEFFLIFKESFIIIISHSFLNLNYQSILIYANLFLLMISKNKNTKFFFLILYLISIFLYYFLVINFRNDNPVYYIYLEFFLIFSLACIVRYNIDNIPIKLIIIFLSIFIILGFFEKKLYYPNKEFIRYLSEQNKLNHCITPKTKEESDKAYADNYSVWTSKIPRSVINQFCDDTTLSLTK
jgi:hypothetical protein